MQTVLKRISPIWEPLSDKTLSELLYNIVSEVAESIFLECLNIGQCSYRNELGQVQTSLANFYLTFKSNFHQAEVVRVNSKTSTDLSAARYLNAISNFRLDQILAINQYHNVRN